MKHGQGSSIQNQEIINPCSIRVPSVAKVPGPLGQQRLNAADRMLFTIDRSLRRMGAAGLDTQTLVWLDGRVSSPRLRGALNSLAELYPASTARLDDAGGLCWRFQPDPAIALAEVDLDSSQPQAVLDYAAGLLSTPADPAVTDLVRFFLLHRPLGRDVFLVQFNHTLIDHRGLLQILELLARWTHQQPPSIPPWQGGTQVGSSPSKRDDPLRQYVRRRLRAEPSRIGQMVEDWMKIFRGGAVQLGSNAGGFPQPVPVRILSRALDSQQTDAFQKELRQTGSWPSISMAVLGSAFRAIDCLAPPGQGKKRYFCTGIGLDLGLRRGGTPVWQNLTSMVPILVPRTEAEDRSSLHTSLCRQLRERLASGLDLGVLRLAALSRRPQTQWTLELMLKYCVSLWFAYFGALDGFATEFCGATVDKVYSVGPTWPPMGLTLLVNQFGGKLFFQVSYVPAAVPDVMANRFLDHVLSDLVP